MNSNDPLKFILVVIEISDWIMSFFDMELTPPSSNLEMVGEYITNSEAQSRAESCTDLLIHQECVI